MASLPQLTLEALKKSLSVCRLEPRAEIPAWAFQGDFFTISRTPDELSIVCAESQVPEGIRHEKGWSCLKVQGPLDFGLTGILASVISPLGKEAISVFTISTFDTDYVMVKTVDFPRAVGCLRQNGHRVIP